MLALLLVAVSVGLSNFAAAIGIGVSGVSPRLRLEVGAVFGVFEAGMPVLGLVVGHRVAATLGGNTRWIGGGLLVATGLYGLYQARHEGGPPSTLERRGRLVASGLALSVDNLVIGFALGTYRVNLALAAIVIGAVSIGLSLIGLELGDRIGTKIGRRGELLGSFVLMLVGVAVASGLL